MGLSSFNRMRRQRNAVELMEAKRFEENNRKRWSAHHTRDANMGTTDEKELSKLRKAEHDAVEKIGELNVQGLKTAVPDAPMRKEHAAEIAGRTMTDMQQGEPMTPTELRTNRVPESAPASEKLVDRTSVEHRGPTVKELQAANVEAGVISAETAAAIVSEAEATGRRRRAENAEEVKVDETSVEQEKAEDIIAENTERPTPATGEAEKSETTKTVETAEAMQKSGASADDAKKADEAARKTEEKTPGQKVADERSAVKAEDAKLPGAGPDKTGVARGK